MLIPFLIRAVLGGSAMSLISHNAAAALAALALAAGAQPALAQTEGEAVQTGVIWTGTIGNLPITACFGDQFWSKGIYYYDKHLLPIRMRELDENAPDVLTEALDFDRESGATWTIDNRSDTSITATWRDGNRSHPIRLTPVAVTFGEYDSACQSAAFVEPLLAGGTVSDRRISSEGLEYTELTYTGSERLGENEYLVITFALDPVEAGDAAINRDLAKALPDGSVEHLMGQCVAMSLPGWQTGYLTETYSPVHVSDRWLGVERAGSLYCGGAHPSHSVSSLVYDRESGEEADPSTWFKPEALDFYEFLTHEDWDTKRPIAGLSDPLLEIVLAHWQADEDREVCTDAAREGTGWEIGLTSEGVSFLRQFPHVIFSCTETVVVPWKELTPFLSEEGRSVRDSIEG